MMNFYRFLTSNAAPALEFLLKSRTGRQKEDPARLNERRGISAIPRPSGALVWVHAASIGEAQSALILINKILENNDNIRILVTTGTLTSARRMEKQLPKRAFHQFYPLDHPDWVRQFLDHWRPDLALWMESELWPNMLEQIRKRNIPAVLVNARLSARSYGKWKLLKPFIADLLKSFSLILAQTETDAERYKNFGAQNILVTDNLKYSAKPLPADNTDLKEFLGALQNRPRWLFASTHAGEEEMACRIHQRLKVSLPDLLTIIAPRHPDRRYEIQSACKNTGLEVLLRGENKTPPDMDTDIYVADTLGELGLLYRAAPLACIGRSFSDDGGGGHNPIEAAQLNCAVLHGPHVQFQKEIYDEMNTAGAAILCANEGKLEQNIHRLLMEEAQLQEQQQRGFDFARKKEKVIDGVWDALKPFLASLNKMENAA